MNYVFIGAHPDDIEYACAGLVKTLNGRGDTVTLIVMTNGESGVDATPTVRIKEQEHAAEKLGNCPYKMLSFEDGNIPVTAATIRQMRQVLDEIGADIVFTHYPEDTHQDHRATAEIVLSAVRGRNSLIYFNSYSSLNFRANLYINIEKEEQGKIEALSCFKTQIEKYKKRNNGFIEKALYINRLNGYECKCDIAEGYHIHSLML